MAPEKGKNNFYTIVNVTLHYCNEQIFIVESHGNRFVQKIHLKFLNSTYSQTLI